MPASPTTGPSSIPERQRVLVTGAAGWLGSRLVRLLVGERQPPPEVYALVRPGANRGRLREVTGVRLVEVDLRDEEHLTQMADSIRPQLCIHFAWYAVPGLYWQSEENLQSLQLSLRLASLLGSRGCRRFVGIGSSAEYRRSERPLSESSPTIATASEPASMYATAKLAGRLLLEQVARLHGMAWTWARVFYQFGPAEDERRLVPTVIQALLAGQPALLTRGDQARDFLHVDDVARAIAQAAGSELDGVVNIGSGEAVTVADVAGAIGELLGRPDLIRLGARPSDGSEPPYVCADVSRLRAAGWQPSYNLHSGLLDTIEWFRRQPARMLSKDGR